jgi:hypothetical protein
MEEQWQEVINDMAKQLVVMENGASTNGTWMPWLNNWRCWHKRSRRRMVKFKSYKRKMRGWKNIWRKHRSNWQTK